MEKLNRAGVLTAAGTLALAATAAANEPIRGKDGANILGPINPARQAEEASTTAPPSTDNGSMPNLKWSFTDSHDWLDEGSWARETTIRARSERIVL